MKKITIKGNLAALETNTTKIETKLKLKHRKIKKIGMLNKKYK